MLIIHYYKLFVCVPHVAPGQVTFLQVKPSTTIFGLNITWGPPSGSNYPTPVTYQLRYRERPSSGSPGGWSSTVQRTATQRQYTTPVLKPGTMYEVEVWAFVSSRSGSVSTMVGSTGEFDGLALLASDPSSLCTPIHWTFRISTCAITSCTVT